MNKINKGKIAQKKQKGLFTLGSFVNTKTYRRTKI